MDSQEDWFRDIVEASHPDTLAHGKGHVLRVVETCKTLARAVQDEDGIPVDMAVLIAAAYLHDLGRLPNVGRLPGVEPPHDEPHATRSATFATAFLSGACWFPVTKIPAVEHAILAHSYSSGLQPESVEAKILSDADKLDAMGAAGILRTVAHSVEHQRGLDDTITHLKTKIATLDEHLVTSQAKIMARGKRELVSRFLDDLLAPGP